MMNKSHINIIMFMLS